MHKLRNLKVPIKIPWQNIDKEKKFQHKSQSALWLIKIIHSNMAKLYQIVQNHHIDNINCVSHFYSLNWMEVEKAKQGRRTQFTKI